MIENLHLVDNQYPWVFRVFFFGLGACLGSFFNVCIYRIPKGDSVVKPGSRCDCGQSIAWYDNLPVLSWILMRGKARCCGKSFSIRYLVVEVLTGFLFLLAWWLFGRTNPAQAIGIMILCGFLVPAVFIDLDHMIIPDVFSIGGAIIGVFFSCLFPALHGVSGTGIAAGILGGVSSLVGILVGSATIYWIGTLGEVALRKEAMGEGDVKLLGAIGAFCGWQGALFSIFGGACVGTILLLPFLLFRKAFPTSRETDSETPDEESMERKSTPPAFGIPVPFGPMLAVGALLYVFFFREPVDTYFQSMHDILNELTGS